MLARRQRQGMEATARKPVHIPAPMGGLNTVAPASAMPPTDAVYCFNLVGGDQGLTSRLGSAEWCTGLTGVSDNVVRSTLPFRGNTSYKLFATTSSGIWDCTASSASPTISIAFADTSGNAGWGVSHVVTTAAGRFLVYCDEVNGLYLYTEGGAWAKVAVGVRQEWEPLTTYAIGNQVVNGGKVYTCDTAGISASSGGPTGTSANTVDGTTRWDYVGAVTTTQIGPCLADQNNTFTADPANFVFGTEWKSRQWFVERNTSRAYYLDTNSIYGTATSFDFGSRFRQGGVLVGLYSWSYDGGNGMDSHLVAISSAGDVVIYGGTDPANADTFGIRGTWYAGAVPAGRKFVADFGGEIVIQCARGLLPLSKLVVGADETDTSQYATRKIASLINRLYRQYGTLLGWGVYVHPEDNTLLLTVPYAEGANTNQLAMSLASKGWGMYRDLPMVSAGVWEGQLYFGTADGRVMRNTGYVDGITLADPNSYTPVEWSVLPAYRSGGRSTEKVVTQLRPIIVSEASSPVYQATAKFDFDSSEPAAPSGSQTGGEDTWGTGTWDDAVWSGELSPSQRLSGSTGMGRFVSVAIRGSAVARTTFVGVDVHLEEGE